MFQSELIGSGINLAEIIDAGIRGACSGSDKIWHYNGDEQPNDEQNN